MKTLSCAIWNLDESLFSVVLHTSVKPRLRRLYIVALYSGDSTVYSRQCGPGFNACFLHFSVTSWHLFTFSWFFLRFSLRPPARFNYKMSFLRWSFQSASLAALYILRIAFGYSIVALPGSIHVLSVFVAYVMYVVCRWTGYKCTEFSTCRATERIKSTRYL